MPIMQVEQFQEPQVLRLAMREIDADELRIAQAAARFAHFRLTKRRRACSIRSGYPLTKRFA